MKQDTECHGAVLLKIALSKALGVPWATVQGSAVDTDPKGNVHHGEPFTPRVILLGRFPR